jgi:hypothetical protein
MLRGECKGLVVTPNKYVCLYTDMIVFMKKTIASLRPTNTASSSSANVSKTKGTRTGMLLK